MKTSKAPTGHRIVLELVNEMQDRLYPLYYRTLAPSLYHVYLHPDDYREIEGVTSLIALDAQRALSARVTRWNRRSRWSALLSDNASVESPPGGWEIHIHPEANGELDRGELGIVSRLSVPAAPQYDAGSPTSRIVRTVVTSSTRRSVVSDEAAPPPIPTLPAPLDADSSNGFARMAYADDEGPHVYAMKKDVVSIGRGGREHWVDLQLVTTARVSREHCRIRRDDRGRFFLHDLSTWGTSVDGKLVGSGSEQELPRQARIQLADAVVIEFQAQPGA